MNGHTGFIHCDPLAFLRLVEFDDGALAELAAMFIETVPQQMVTLHAAATAADRVTLGDLVHKLKGSLGIFHAAPAIVLVEAVEARLRAGGAVAPDLVLPLTDEIGALCDELVHCVARDEHFAALLAAATAPEAALVAAAWPAGQPR